MVQISSQEEAELRLKQWLAEGNDTLQKWGEGIITIKFSEMGEFKGRTYWHFTAVGGRYTFFVYEDGNVSIPIVE